MSARAPALLLAMALLAVAWAWAPQSGGQAQSRSEHVHHRHFRVRAMNGESQRALAMFPRRRDRQHHLDDARYPLLVALHGRGEALRGPDRGFVGWSVDYGLPKAFGALMNPPLSEQAYGGLVSDGHLDAVNRELARDPFEGCLVVTPYVPDLLEDSSPQELKRYVDWLAGSFLEQVRDRFEQAARGRAATGIDGVSLGGWVALEAGFRHPEVFGSVGGIQPAIRGRVSGLAARAAGARGQGHRPHIRLLTSSEDPFLEPTRDLSRALRERRVPHRLLELPGPHDYDFNRGPGRMELLRFHEQVLEQEPLGK